MVEQNTPLWQKIRSMEDAFDQGEDVYAIYHGRVPNPKLNVTGVADN
jgi:hypothetical protein